MISVEPAWCEMVKPDTSGFSLNTSAPPGVVSWLVVSTVARTSGVPPPPGSPLGMMKSNIALFSSPELMTSAFVPGSPVVTEPVSYTHLKLCSTLETTARFKRWLMMCFFAQPARR